MSELPAVSLGSLLRSLRAAAGLTQEELAEAARVSYRTVSDLERGVSRSPHRDTARLLADDLGLSGDELARFEDVARGRRSATGTVAPGVPPKGIAAARTVPRQLPAHTAHFVGRADELAALADLLDKAVGPSRLAAGTTMIAAIGGTAGIGNPNPEANTLDRYQTEIFADPGLSLCRLWGDRAAPTLMRGSQLNGDAALLGDYITMPTTPLVRFRQANEETRAAYLRGLHHQRGLNDNPSAWRCTQCGETVAGVDVLTSYGVGDTPIPFCPTDKCFAYGPDLRPAEV
jgi:transcriptional regulator with XRE-family HTH domain